MRRGFFRREVELLLRVTGCTLLRSLGLGLRVSAVAAFPTRNDFVRP
jgi:hypothetical protein